MARPHRCRRICKEPIYNNFVPYGICCDSKVTLTVDEYETIRLIDLEKLNHQQCANQMDISRTTVTEIYQTARQKIADSIVNGKPLFILGGHYRICDGSANRYCHKNCIKSNNLKEVVNQKGVNEMRIAVTYENGNVFQHFGHTEQFKLYDVEDNQIKTEQIVNTNGQGHGVLADFLTDKKVDVLICGGIGGGAKSALNEAKIQLFGGVSGEADNAVKDYIAGNLKFDANVHCDHHEHEHKGHCNENQHHCSGNSCK